MDPVMTETAPRVPCPEIAFHTPAKTRRATFVVDLLTKFDTLGILTYVAMEAGDTGPDTKFVIDYGRGPIGLSPSEILPWLGGYIAGLRANPAFQEAGEQVIYRLYSWIESSVR
jgi:hypothetical protein